MSDEGRHDAGGSVRPGWVRQPVGRLVVRGTQGHWLTGRAAELLLTGRRVHPDDEQAAQAASRLAGLLAAAGGRPPGSAGPADARPVPHTRASALDPAREEAALAAFRAVHGSAAADHPVAEGVSVLGRPRAAASRTTRRPLRMTVAAVASVVALSGVAVAVAATSGRLALPGEGSGGAGPASSRPPAATTAGAGAAGTATDAPGATATPAPPAASGPGSTAGRTGPAGVNGPAGPAGSLDAPRGSRAWCTAYLRTPAGRTGELAVHCRQLVKQHSLPAAGKSDGTDPQKSEGNSDGQGNVYSVKDGSSGSDGGFGVATGGSGGDADGGQGKDSGNSGHEGHDDGSGEGKGSGGAPGSTGQGDGNGQGDRTGGANGKSGHSGSSDDTSRVSSPPASGSPGQGSVSASGGAPASGAVAGSGLKQHSHHPSTDDTGVTLTPSGAL